jgi:hypothetical protein
MTRLEVIMVLGVPDDISIGTRKYPTPGVYKYGDIEYHFGPRKEDTLWLVYSEDEAGDGITWLKD